MLTSLDLAGNNNITGDGLLNLTALNSLNLHWNFRINESYRSEFI